MSNATTNPKWWSGRKKEVTHTDTCNEIEKLLSRIKLMTQLDEIKLNLNLNLIKIPARNPKDNFLFMAVKGTLKKKKGQWIYFTRFLKSMWTYRIELCLALPVPFWGHGFLPPPLTSGFVLVCALLCKVWWMWSSLIWYKKLSLANINNIMLPLKLPWDDIDS